MASEFDEASDGKLSDFVSKKEDEGVTYPLVQPFIIKMEKAEDVATSAGSKISSSVDSVIGKTKKLVDTFSSSMAAVSNGL